MPRKIMIDEIIRDLTNDLRNADGHEVAYIYNDICHAEHIEYCGDDTWQTKENK